MQIRVDLSGLEMENKRSKQAPHLLKERLVEIVYRAAYRTTGKVKSVMPVLSGRARSHWGIFTPEHIVNHLLIAQSPILAEPIWRFSDGGLTHEQGVAMTPHNYIDDLNNGSSQQAPMMFLDTIAEQEATTIHNEALQVAGEIL